MIAWRLLAGRLLAGLVVAHLAGVLLLSLAVLVEAAALPAGQLLPLLGERVPGLWSRVASALSLLGAALATGRMRRDGTLLGLSTLGVGPGRALVVAALLGLVPGVLAAVAPEVAVAPPEWTRGEGGWIHADGRVRPDTPGGTVRPWPAPGTGPERIPTVVLGATAGAAAGLAWPALPILLLASAWTVGEAVVEPVGDALAGG